MPVPPIQVSILINSEVFARGIDHAIKEMAFDDVEVSMDHIEQTIIGIRQASIDILVLDSHLARQVAPHLGRSKRKPRVILVSERNHAGIRLPIRKNDACGFFPARAPESRLVHFLGRMIDCTRRAIDPRACLNCPVPESLQPRDLLLTRRENEVFRELGLLRTNSEIAEKLSVSTKTVEAHTANIKRKLKLDNSRQLLQAAIDWVEGR